MTAVQSYPSLAPSAQQTEGSSAPFLNGLATKGTSAARTLQIAQEILSTLSLNPMNEEYKRRLEKVRQYRPLPSPPAQPPLLSEQERKRLEELEQSNASLQSRLQLLIAIVKERKEKISPPNELTQQLNESSETSKESSDELIETLRIEIEQLAMVVSDTTPEANEAAARRHQEELDALADAKDEIITSLRSRQEEILEEKGKIAAQLLATQQELNRCLEELKTVEDQLDQVKQLNERLQREKTLQAEQHTVQLRAKDLELEQKEEALRTQKEDLETKHQEQLGRKEEKISEFKRLLEAARYQLDEQSKASHIAEQQKRKIQELTDQTKASARKVAEQENELSSLDRRYSEKLAEIIALQKQLASDKTRFAAEREQLLAEAGAEQSSLRDTITGLQSELEKREKVLQTMATEAEEFQKKQKQLEEGIVQLNAKEKQLTESWAPYSQALTSLYAQLIQSETQNQPVDSSVLLSMFLKLPNKDPNGKQASWAIASTPKRRNPRNRSTISAHQMTPEQQQEFTKLQKALKTPPLAQSFRTLPGSGSTLSSPATPKAARRVSEASTPNTSTPPPSSSPVPPSSSSSTAMQELADAVPTEENGEAEITEEEMDNAIAMLEEQLAQARQYRKELKEAKERQRDAKKNNAAADTLLGKAQKI